MKEKEFLQSLLQATRYFSDVDVCVEFVASLRWMDGADLPTLRSKDVVLSEDSPHLKCMAKDCRKQFSVKTGTIFEDLPSR